MFVHYSLKAFFPFANVTTVYNSHSINFHDISLESDTKIIEQIYVDLKHSLTSLISELGREGLKKYWRKDLSISAETYSWFTN